MKRCRPEIFLAEDTAEALKDDPIYSDLMRIGLKLGVVEIVKNQPKAAQKPAEAPA